MVGCWARIKTTVSCCASNYRWGLEVSLRECVMVRRKGMEGVTLSRTPQFAGSMAWLGCAWRAALLLVCEESSC